MLVRHRIAILSAVTLFCAAPAHAATLVNSGGTLTYTAAPGGISDLSFVQNPAPDTTVEIELNGDADPIVATGCTADGDFFICPGVSAVVMDLGDADDYVEVVRMRGPITINGGVGDDALYTESPGVSVLDGGPGSDYVFASGPAADTINGGDGDDIVGFVPYDTAHARRRRGQRRSRPRRRPGRGWARRRTRWSRQNRGRVGRAAARSVAERAAPPHLRHDGRPR